MRFYLWIGRMLATSVLCLGCGCTTVLRGSEQTMRFQTDPSGAVVRINDQTYTTPAQVQLKRATKYRVEISKPGYRSITFDLVGEIDGMSLAGNFLLPAGNVGDIMDDHNGSNKTFYDLKIITLRMPATTDPGQAPLKVRPFKGQLLDDSEYARAVQVDDADKSQFFKGQP